MRRYLWPAVSLILAAGLQGNLPAAVSVWSAKPDLVLVVLIAFSLAADPTFGASLGFLAGLLHGSAVGLSLGSFIATRTIVGFLAGFIPTRLFSENPAVPVLSATGLTAACEGVFLLANPRPDLAHVARIVAGECAWNAILTLVLCWILRYYEARRKLRLVNARL